MEEPEPVDALSPDDEDEELSPDPPLAESCRAALPLP